MNAKVSRLKRQTFLKVLALVVITSLLISGRGFSALAQGLLPSRDTNPPGLLGQCSTALSEVSYNAQTGKVRFIGSMAGKPIAQLDQIQAPASPEEAARAYLSVCGSLFGVGDQATELQLMRFSQAAGGRSVLRFQQTYQGVPVYGAQLVVQLDAANNVFMINGDMSPEFKLETTPTINAAPAQKIALQKLTEQYGGSSDGLTLTSSEPALNIYDPKLIQPDGGETALVWLFTVSQDGPPPVRQLVMVDAQSGEIALSLNLLDTAKNRMTYDMNNGTAYPGTLRCNEANPNCTGGDTDEVNAHVYAGDTYDFYWSYHNRDSIDNAGMTLKSHVHYDVGYCNAFWDGSRMTYGDNSGTTGCFIVVDDVVAHEMTHGVTEYESGLIYSYQSGAINESFSDIWGEWIDLTNGKGNDAPAVRWQVGEDTSIGAIRNMKDPTVFGDPDRMDSPNYYHGSGDNGGVHINSGVGNKAAYLITDGDTFNGYTVTGIGVTKAAKIYYEVQTNILTPSSNYYALYLGLYQACNNLVGTSGITADDCTQVRNATLATEMDHYPPPPPAANDDFDAATVISSLPYTDSVNTAGATTAADDPTFSCVSDKRNNSVWYRYTPDAATALTFNTTGSDYDTVLAVWTGSRGSLTSVACNDDSGGLQSKVTFAASAGVTYSIEIASYGAGGGSLKLNALLPIPAAPTNLAASDGTFTDKVQVTWTASATATYYEVYRATSASGTKSLLGGPAASPYNDTTATPGITYYYWAKACSGSGCSGFSTSDTGWRNLTAPTGVAASDGTFTDKVQISWTASSGATSYQVYRAASAAGTKAGPANTAATSVNDTAATPGVTYYYFVKACRGTRCSDFSAYDTGWRKLSPPTNVLASDGTYPSKVQITWTASLGATSYKVYRATSATGTPTLLGSSTGTTYDDTLATPGVTYYYWVKAFRGSSSSDFSAYDSGRR
jgi:Zn-dependent metalloprotease/fibronectin type 3 domain-containing protein